MRVAIAPATPEDFAAVVGHGPAARAHVLVARRDGEAIGLGGFVQAPDGRMWVSMVATPAFRRYPAALVRAGLEAMALARRLRLREVFAVADASEPRAERFLERFGFVRCDSRVEGEAVYRWQP
jgi:RimJ/RimL family protein N-acetyltransferase